VTPRQLQTSLSGSEPIPHESRENRADVFDCAFLEKGMTYTADDEKWLHLGFPIPARGQIYVFRI
jgi:hypothetical protein